MKRPIVVSGFMATGKSTVGRLVAERLGVPFLDTDEILARTTGIPVPELFMKEGEAKFREREAALVMPMLSDPTPRVIAFGGGTATIQRVRHAALETTTLISLLALPETVAKRVQTPGDRPNLATRDPLGRATDLLAMRREAYGECHGRVDTDEMTAADTADRVIALAARDTLAMPLGMRSYAVELCEGDPPRLSDLLRDLAPSSVIVVTDENVQSARSSWIDAAVVGHRTHRIVLPPGEAGKNVATVSRLWDSILGFGVDRDAVVVAFGGGVVGDLAGFVASTVLRGVRCVQVATTLLSMVDSSVGGKTGFDHAAGKNLIGAFFQPTHVVIDLEHLSTLAPREVAAGFAEIVKIALVRDADLVAALEGGASTRELVERAVRAKIRVVRDDERETGPRALLNLGHTVGHALEAHAGYGRLLHGEAVAIGTVLEMRACEVLGLTPKGLSARAAGLLSAHGLPTDASHADIEASWSYVLTDKKRAANGVKLPIVTSLGEGRVERVALDRLREALLA